ncbi:hypothetical protein D1B33_00075 [Lysinibacillus yapensis]|uniref:YpoC-like domain-containing protein n=1 Tax=Ureibacillus yapensis TaxID=2304605 RepID=A0A396SJV0_9BACL|nr:hypothetical protein [Lysinibacillus yapensis]RHW39287.1 hypothetical protein D1B33_00075 [Lysinibacillus yapensis]
MNKAKRELIDKEIVEPFFEQWQNLSAKIYQSHEVRDGQAKSLMEQGIELFERCVVHCSDTSETAVSEREEYEVLPINGKERLQFIKARPGQYACYRQLDELFKELKKRLARLRLKA